MNTRLLLLCTLLLPSLPLPAQEAATPENEPVVRAVQGALPTVVNIYTEGYVETRVRDPFDEFFDFYGQSATRGNRVAKVPVRSLGSGALISPEGYIVTNFHVVERASETVKIKVSLHDKRDFEAVLVRVDEDLDLALIKITAPAPLPFLNMEQLSPNLLGQTVIAIGNPVGYESSVSRGILSATERTVNVNGLLFEGLLQTDAAINPGNSGGPLVDINGRLVGINTIKMGRTRAAEVENIGFAIPAEKVRAFAGEAIAIAKGEKPEPPKVSLAEVLEQRFGLKVAELTPELARRNGFRQPYTGLIVTEVLAGSPAGEAGMEAGMLIAGIGNTTVRSLGDLPRQLTRVKTGDPVKFSLRVLVAQGQVLMVRSGAIILNAQ